MDISAQANTYLENADTRNVVATLKANGNDISGHLRSLSLKKGSCGGSSFRPQSVYSNSMTAEIYNGSIKKGSKVEVFFSVPESGDSTDYKVATLYARNSSEKGDELILEAEGAISYKLGREYTGGVGLTINEMIAYISNSTGIEITLEDGLNGDYKTNPNANLSGRLMREILGDIAGCFFGFATESTENSIVIRKYKNSNKNFELKQKRMSDYPDIYDTVTIEGVQVKTRGSDGQVDYVYPEGIETVNCILYNPLMTEELFYAHVGNFVGLSYTPFSAEMMLGNFAVEPNDLVTVNGKQTIVTEITYYYDGGLKSSLSAATTNSGEEYSRTEKMMESDIAFEKFKFEIPDFPNSPEDNADGYIHDTYCLHTTDDIISIYKGYMGVICWDAYLINRSSGWDYSLIQIPAKYMPAYPVTITGLGMSSQGSGMNTYMSANSNRYTAVQLTLHPELNEDGFVKVTSAVSFLSPRDPYYWGDLSPIWLFNDFDDRSLDMFQWTRFCTFYILADKYDDFINGRL